ncbi:MAG TPA: ATP-binding protein [Kofleriaceae bacterium]|nr:ATP-binding protein [Kofleriaceae bacterium]
MSVAEPPEPRDRRPPLRTVIADMVHDLRNPLSALAGNLALLREELAGIALGRVAQQSLDDAVALADRALAMVTTIADVDALEAGAVQARPRPTQLRAIVDEALTTIAADIAARALTVSVAVDPELVFDVDGRLVGRLVQNLLDNAARHATRGGRVEVAASVGADGALALSVGNSGPPLSADEREALFAHDFRLAERRAAARRGRALGMYFCRLVADAHRGTLSVEERPGLPATFVLRLPG